MLFRLPVMYQISQKLYSFIAKNRTVERCTFENCTIPGTTNKYIDTDKLKIFNDFYIRDLKKISFIFLFWVLVFFQINSTFNFGIIKRTSIKYNILLEITEQIFYFKKQLKNISHKYIGITNHGVFLDGHYKGFDNIYTLSFDGELLPIYTEKGQPDTYQKGGVWANYNFRVNGPWVEFETKKLQKGLIRYSAFYIGENKKEFKNATFKILKKKIRANFEWEKDLLKENLKTPWVEVGELKWNNSKPIIIKY
jgi:hypothetical protein